MSSKPRFVGEKVKLGELISKAKVERCGNRSFPVYSMTMHDGIVEQSGRFKKTIASKDTSSYKVVKKNQLVVGFPIDEGVIYVQNHDQPGIMSPAYNVWDFDSDRILPAYLEFALHSPQSMAYYAGKMRGTTARRRTLTGDALKNMPVPVPSIEDQYTVVKTLNCIKSQLAATQQMLDKLDQLVKSRFVEMFASGGFPIVSFGDACLRVNNGITRRGNDPDGDIVLRLVELQEGFIDYAKPNRIRLTQKEKERFSLVDGDLLFARVNGNPKSVGRCASFSAINEFVYHNDHVIRATFDHSKYNPEFLVFFMNSSKGRAQIEAAITTSAGQYTINQAGIKSIQVPLPPLAFQQEFAAFVSQVDKSRFIAQQQIEKLQMLYNSLAQDYFGD